MRPKGDVGTFLEGERAWREGVGGDDELPSALARNVEYLVLARREHDTRRVLLGITLAK